MQTIARKRIASTALAGLSRGGVQAQRTGIAHQDLFAWLGLFSGAWGNTGRGHQSVKVDQVRFNDQTPLLWLGVGKQDLALKGMEEFHTYLEENKIRHVWHLTDGIHEFTLWRPYLAEFVSLLFRPE